MNIAPISCTSPPKCLHVSPWPNSCDRLDEDEHDPRQGQVLQGEEIRAVLGEFRRVPGEHERASTASPRRTRGRTPRVNIQRKYRSIRREQPVGIDERFLDVEDAADERVEADAPCGGRGTALMRWSAARPVVWSTPVLLELVGELRHFLDGLLRRQGAPVGGPRPHGRRRCPGAGVLPSKRCAAS